MLFKRFLMGIYDSMLVKYGAVMVGYSVLGLPVFGPGKEKYLANTLNNTAIATSRGMIAVLENNQNEDGSITIPDVLVKYMNGKVLIGRD